MNDNKEDSQLEVIPPSAIEATERAQIDVQISTAHAFPRSLDLFRKRAFSMATVDQETAESCVYCRPVGKEKNDKGQWVEKFAEGASIRLAEIVGASYGNLRVAARIVEQTPRYVRCEGVAHDLESNYAGKAECVESTVNKEGQPYSERQRALIAKVCIAKAYRDAIFKVVPRALCKPVLEQAKIVAAGKGLSIEQRRENVKRWLGQRKVDEARVFAVLGVKGWPDIGEEQLTILTGLKTATGPDGDLTIEEAFPPVNKAANTSDLQAGGLPRGQTAPPTGAAAAPAGVSTTQTPATEAKSQPAATQDAGQGTNEAAKTATPPAETKPLPTCKYCHAEVADMAQHNCEQMKAAVAKDAASDIAGAKPGENTSGDAVEALNSMVLLLQQNQITEKTFMRWADANKVSRKGQTKINELSTAKLLRSIAVFHKILPELQKLQATP